MKLAVSSTQMNMLGCVPIELYLQKQGAGWIGSMDLILLASALDIFQDFLYNISSLQTNTVK